MLVGDNLWNLLVQKKYSKICKSDVYILGGGGGVTTLGKIVVF